MEDKIIRLIPPEEQAYEWARKEMERYFPKPDRYRLVNLQKAPDRPMVHKSFFRKGETDPVIMRVFWADTNSVRYIIIENYDELRTEHPELVERLLLNGQYAYEEILKKDPEYVTGLLYGFAKGRVC